MYSQAEVFFFAMENIDKQIFCIPKSFETQNDM